LTYDWFMTQDTDAFVRFAALARRNKYIDPTLTKPREQQILWGMLMPSDRHWRDSSKVPQDQRVDHGPYQGQWYSADEAYEGSWYHYPAGMGYLIRYLYF
jgi:hypothetical protein